MSDDEKDMPESFRAIRAAEAERLGISAEELQRSMNKRMRAAWQEAMKREATRRGITAEELLKLIEQEAERERWLVELMAAGGVVVRGRGSAALAAQRGETVIERASKGGESTAKARMAEKASAAQEAARIWDSLTTIPERNRGSVVAQRMGVSEPTARNYLRVAGRKAKTR